MENSVNSIIYCTLTLTFDQVFVTCSSYCAVDIGSISRTICVTFLLAHCIPVCNVCFRNYYRSGLNSKLKHYLSHWRSFSSFFFLYFCAGCTGRLWLSAKSSTTNAEVCILVMCTDVCYCSLLHS